MDEINAVNLIKIGFEQSKENPNLYTRHDGDLQINGGSAGLYASVFSTPEETKEDNRGEVYVKWEESIKEEIRKMLGK